jgi:hypothetical protein
MMKKLLYGILICSVVGGMMACSNGDYQADPQSPVNGVVNPATPLSGDEFSWSGSEPLSMDVNGKKWVADFATFVLDTSGSNVITAYKTGSPAMIHMVLRDVWKDNVYAMEWQNYSRRSEWYDSVQGNWVKYTSDRSNSGGVKILRNDTAVIEGKFYFKGVSIDNKTVNISNGYFKVVK